jgi:endonuclease YncB( thermonuclease family)
MPEYRYRKGVMLEAGRRNLISSPSLNGWLVSIAKTYITAGEMRTYLKMEALLPSDVLDTIAKGVGYTRTGTTTTQPTTTGYPKTVTRAPYSFTANSIAEESQLKNFLGIEPAGKDIDTYLSELSPNGRTLWADYWTKEWTAKGRTDLVSFVKGKIATIPAIKPPVVDVLTGIWDYFTKTVPEFYGNTPEALLIPFAAVAQGLEGLGALFKGTTTVASEEGQALIKASLPNALAKTVTSSSWISSIIKSIKANPLMTIFVVTEIPNYLQMTQFATHQLAQDAGKTLPQIESQLTSLGSALKNAGFDFDTAIKNKDTAGATTILTSMKGTLAQLRATIDTNKEWLTRVGTIGNYNALYELYSSTITAAEATLPGTTADLTTIVKDRMEVQVTKVIDGDTVEVTTQGMPSVTFKVRILGENAPDHDLTVYWVKSLIDGIETRYEVTAADYKASNAYAVTNLQRSYVILRIDEANKMDKYDRVLASIRYGTGYGDFAKDMIRKGLAVCYLLGSNQYVDEPTLVEAQDAAQREGLGMWANVTKQNMGTLAVTSAPSNAKLYVDEKYTGRLTPETLTLAPGKYIVITRRTGYDPAEKKVTVASKEKTEIRLEMTKSGLAGETTGGTTEQPTTQAFTISIDSVPSNAKLYIDNIYTHHLTPADEKELKDVMRLLTPGQHKISANKSGYYGETTVEIVAGENAPIVLTLI